MAFFCIISHLRIILVYNIVMIICICKRVSDRDIARCARAGMGFDELQWELGVATQCGACESCARDTLAQCQTSEPVAFISPATDTARPAT
jgi:bacterioferritin-associated ferredoxin